MEERICIILLPFHYHLIVAKIVQYAPTVKLVAGVVHELNALDVELAYILLVLMVTIVDTDINCMYVPYRVQDIPGTVSTVLRIEK